MSEQITREEWLEEQRDVARAQAEALMPIVDAFARTQIRLREHYAGLALQGLLAAGCAPIHAAELAVESADFLLASLEPHP